MIAALKGRNIPAMGNAHRIGREVLITEYEVNTSIRQFCQPGIMRRESEQPTVVS